MKEPIAVVDRAGNLVIRHDGAVLDGDTVTEHKVRDGVIVRVRRAFALADHAAASTMSETTRESAARILGDAYVETDYRGLTDEGARHAIVRRALGDAAKGKSDHFLDGAWRGFTGDTSSPAATSGGAVRVALDDAQRAVAQEGVRLALEHNAKLQGVADRGPVNAALAERDKALADGWKTPETRAAEAGAKAVADKDPQGPKIGALREKEARLRDGWKTPPRSS